MNTSSLSFICLGTYGHIKNLLQFLEGSKPMWYDPDRLEKRSYVRRKVHRGKV